ncbi:hypothetical protein SSX86_007210 [Deinandra increscens subsp. villosa]|uniref:4-coumarate--CoA ligase n=1 Tax=Deinandra increscens subsp. villosa TaxID=3103831 RepID=A0AAP0DL03_9ASTR
MVPLHYKPFTSYLNKQQQAATVNNIRIISNTTKLQYCSGANNCKLQLVVRCDQSLLPSTHHSKSKPMADDQQLANYVPLSPISFLERATQVYRDRLSVVYGPDIKYTWEQTHRRCLNLASALNHLLGVSPGDVVATLAPNIPAMVELHFAIPMAGAIISPLNTRLDPNMISTLLRHSEAKVLFVDYHLLHLANQAIQILKNDKDDSTQPSPPPLLVTINHDQPLITATYDHKNQYDYETLVETPAVSGFSISRPLDECDPISLNYTSGTTSKPKGVLYSHRGAYLNALSCVHIHRMGEMPTYLWSVPMFHCNGWCLPWGVAAVGGTNVCLRRIDPDHIFHSIVLHKVTHMGGAPTVLNMIANSSHHLWQQLPHNVEIMTAGAPPPPSVLSKIEELGFRVSHGYGLTETYSLGTWCLWKPEWDVLGAEEKGKLKARQGVKHFGMEEVDVKDPVTMESVKCDGESIGEIMFRGNTIMSGYLKDERATKEAFAGGWFRSGDLGVKHEDGYIEVKDRAKDIVISGGENISTIEVESVIYTHEGVLEVAVVGRPDDHWGQTPCAFVKLKEGVNIDAEEIIKYCRDHMPHYMAPRTVVFQDLPRNSAGKIEKHVLKDKAKNL